MDSSKVTRLLEDLTTGRSQAADQLLPHVYDELRRLAENYMNRERRDHVLQPTALVHEAYMRLVDQAQPHWNGRTHFYAVAARAMQRVLIDYARAANRQKRGGPQERCRRVALTDAFTVSQDQSIDALDLEQAMEKMAAIDPRQAQVAQMRLFGDMTYKEISEVLSVSERTVERDWKMARAWLGRELNDSEPM